MFDIVVVLILTNQFNQSFYGVVDGNGIIYQGDSSLSPKRLQ